MGKLMIITDALSVVFRKFMDLDLRVKALILAAVVIVLAALVWKILPQDRASAAGSSVDKQDVQTLENENPDLSFNIKPVDTAELTDGETSFKEGLEESGEKEGTLLQEQFALATEHALNQQWSDAESTYAQLIEEYPFAVEAYVNLAVVYARTNRLDEAREILVRGVTTSPNYSILYENLQSIHGALAAEAYREALASKDNTPAEVDLRLISEIDLQSTGLSQLKSKSRNMQLETELLAENDALTLQQEEFRNKIAQLEAQVSELSLALVEKPSVTDSTQGEKQVDSELISQAQVPDEPIIEDEIVVVSEVQINDEPVDEDSVNIEFVDTVVNATEVEVAPVIESPIDDKTVNEEQLDIETVSESHVDTDVVSNSEVVPVVKVIINDDPTAIIETETQSESRVDVTQEVAQIEEGSPVDGAQVVLTDVEETTQEEINIATELVEVWAKFWSNQYVDGYVSSYVENYSPVPEQLTHDEWVRQHNSDISDKEFIQVDVSDFDVVEAEDQFSVTFTQRYRTDAIDDTIRKTLVFSKGGDSWYDAKIIEEFVVSD